MNIGKTFLIIILLFLTASFALNPRYSLATTSQAHSNKVLGLEFSPDGKTLISVSADKTISLWTNKGEHITTLKRQNRWVKALAVNPKGETFLTGTGKGSVKLWTYEGKLKHEYKELNSSISALTFTPDGNHFLAAEVSKSLKLYDLQGKEIQSFDRTVEVYDENGEFIKNEVLEQINARCVDISPDGKWIVFASHCRIYKWHVNGQLIGYKRGCGVAASYILDIKISNDGRFFSTIDGHNRMQTWSKDLEKIKLYKDDRRIGRSTGQLAFDPQSKHIAFTSAKYGICIWDFKKGKVVRGLDPGNDIFTSVAFSPTNKLIAAGTYDGKIFLWNKKGELIKRLTAK